MVSEAICGHCGRYPNGFGFAFGVDLCHNGIGTPWEEPLDCYRLVTIYGHRLAGSCW